MTNRRLGRVRTVALAVAMLAPSYGPAQPLPPVAYRLTYPAGGDVVRIRLHLDRPLRGGVLVMPRAVPMGYGEFREIYAAALKPLDP